MHDKTGLRALIFDYGGVLMRTVDPRPRRELEHRFDLKPGEIYDLIFRSPRWNEVQHGRIDSDAFWQDVGERLHLDAGQLDEFRRGFWRGDRLDEELVDLIRYLGRQGYKTALLSNAPPDMGGYLRELGIEDAFDVIVISGDEGITKPDPEIYHRALGRLDVAAREAVFIDDMRENVEAARRVRLRATRFRGTAPLYGWLQSLGISLPERRFDAVPDVRAVIFDWGGVMEELPSEDDVAAWERRLGLGSGVLPDVLWGKTWRRLSVGAISDEEYADDVANRLGLPGRDEALSFLQVFYTRDRLNDAIVRAARSLRERYKVALLSNAFPGQVETILKHHDLDIHAEFDVYVNSALVGVSKPDPRIYQIALERLDVEPDQAVFLDDMVRNVDSARELGIHAIQFADPGRSLADLEKLLGHEIDA